MKQIRTKIILLLLIITLLPLIPLAITVNTLVEHSLKLGLNTQFEDALESGVEFSKDLYQLRRERLLSQASEIAREMAGIDYQQISSEKFSKLINESGYWNYFYLAVLNEDGSVDRQWHLSQTNIKVRLDYLKKMQTSQSKQQFFRDESEKFFTVVQLFQAPSGDAKYIYLVSKMRGDFFEQAQQLLSLRRLYTSISFSLDEIPRTFLYSFLLIYFVVIVFAVVLGVLISARISSPIKNLVQATEEIGRGNLDYQVEIRSKDEIGQLMTHFNQMAKNLKENQERMIYLEKMAAWQEIARRLAHEIKNPLTPIQLTIQQIVDQDSGEDQEYSNLLKESHQIINEEIGSLRKLVNEFSEFGRMPELNLKQGHPAQIIKEVAGLYPQHKIEMSLPGESVIIECDEDRIKRVLINLLQNAVQSYSNKKPITINLVENENEIEIQVRDQGPGMTPQVKKQIFEPYFSTKKSGVGLGLAITRKMIEEHGGRITVESEPGKGSCFTVYLPKRVR
jgi:nitrogen fixation/metabolism regulation signal transduction histidine kinase